MFKEKGSLKFLIEFPEKEKVFESVTQATTVFLFATGRSSKVFSLSVGLNSAVLPPDSHADIHWAEVESLFGDALVFPLIKSNYELELMKVIHKNSKNLKNLVSCYQGDVNVSSRKSDLRNVKTDFLLVRGEHVQAYGVNLSDRDPDRRWIEIKKSELKGTLEPVTRERLVMQGISNMGTKFRLQVGKIPAGVVVGHSANVLEVINDEIDVNSTLAILNSKLMNWYYKKISTNNNVNIYEMNDLPIKVFEGQKLKKINSLVDRVLKLKSTKNPTSKLNEELESLQSQIDILVYELYEIESNQIKIIEEIF
jgi:hypothetical protein